MCQETYIRPDGRTPKQARKIIITPDYTKYAEGSCLMEMGETKVICTASIDRKVPAWMTDAGRGWITAEYGMLPRATGTRTDREAAKGRQSGRTQEIQRLIGRSLRAAVDLEKLGPVTLKIDCDVIQADAGTRCASITGGFVALTIAVGKMLKARELSENPIRFNVAAVSVGIFDGYPICDLNYEEDHQCDTDMNVIMTSAGGLVEIQGTAEGAPFSREELNSLLELAQGVSGDLFNAQNKAIEEAQNE